MSSTQPTVRSTRGQFGFVRVAVGSHKVGVGKCTFNGERIIAMMRRATKVNARILILNELGVTSYTGADLFRQQVLTDMPLETIEAVRKATETQYDGLLAIGAPLVVDCIRYNCAVVMKKGKILGVVPKIYPPNYGEFHEELWFAGGGDMRGRTITINGQEVPFGIDLLFEADDVPGLVVGFEVCEDGWAVIPPHRLQALAGATIIGNLSASNELAGKPAYRSSLMMGHSAEAICAYAYASSGAGESTTDAVFGGHLAIGEYGAVLTEKEPFSEEEPFTYADIDVQRLVYERTRINTFRNNKAFFKPMLDAINFRRIKFTCGGNQAPLDLQRFIDAHPFVPSDPTQRDKRCRHIFEILVRSLRDRLAHLILGGLPTLVQQPGQSDDEFQTLLNNQVKDAVAKHVDRLLANGRPVAVLGKSGGSNSTLALLVACAAFDQIGLPRKLLFCYALPGYGTTKRTYNNSYSLMRLTGVTTVEVNIRARCLLSWQEEGYKPFGIDTTGLTVEQFVEKLSELGEDAKDLGFENKQARARTDVLMNAKGGAFVIGTGDMSELFAGWCTYQADHMSMYNPFAGVPKTLVHHLIRWAADFLYKASEMATVLHDVCDTAVSPELLPVGKNGELKQKTDSSVGPQDLRDFFVYEIRRWGSAPSKILYLATHAKFKTAYTPAEIRHWLRLTISRYFTQRFKHSCSPDSPKVGSVSPSPRYDCHYPSDASPEEFLRELDLNAPTEMFTTPEAPVAGNKETVMNNTPAGTTNGAAPVIVRALGNIDGTNDFADYEQTADHPASLLPVPGGRKIGPVIGRIQREGKAKGLYAKQFGVRDAHKPEMFNFAENCPDKKPYLDKVADRDGEMITVYPLHMLPDTWGFEWIEGTEPALFDQLFRKGEALDKDEFSGARPEVIQYLRDNGVTHVDLVGLVLRICVGLTAIDLVKAGFKVRVITDATCDLEIPEMQKVLDEMKSLGVELVTADEVLA